MVSNAGASPGPLRLLQQTAPSSAALIVGTLYEGVDYGDEFSSIEHGQEQVLLLMASIHLSDLIWTVMELGDGLTPQVSRRIHHDNMDPLYGKNFLELVTAFATEGCYSNFVMGDSHKLRP